MSRRFTQACLRAFRMLVDRYGFGEPEIEPIGRETFVRYHRGHQTISVAYEPGSPPIVELFHPAAETCERPVPWAAREGVPRCRRIPRLAVSEPFNEEEEAGFERHLEASARALERVERQWLASGRAPGIRDAPAERTEPD